MTKWNTLNSPTFFSIFITWYRQEKANRKAGSYRQFHEPTPSEAARNALGGKRVLLVLDGTEDADDLLRVLRVAGGCGVLITSRSSRDGRAGRQDILPLELDKVAEL